MRISDWSSDVCSSDLYGDALLLPAGERRRQGIHMVGEADPCEQFLDLLSTARLVGAGAGLAANAQRQRDVLARRQVVEQSEVLEHDSAAPARRSEEHTSELQSLMRTSVAAFC